MDRHSKYTLLEQVDRKTADSVAEVLTRRMMPFRDQVHTLTADNGKEFAGHRAVSKALAADFYFAAPYHSWERGLNEYTRSDPPVLPEGDELPQGGGGTGSSRGEPDQSSTP